MNKTPPTGAKSLLITEISEVRAFLGAEMTAEDYKQLQRETVPQLIQEAQLLTAAIQLRQHRQVAENIREEISFNRGRRGSKNGPIMS